MKLTEVAIKRPAFITMVFVALAVLGIFGYSRMGVDLLPKMDWPIVSVVTVYPGAGPKEIETLVSKPIEEAIVSINKLDNVRSYSNEGVSVVLAQFDMSADVDEVTNEIQRKVETVRSQLPKDAEAPRIQKSDMNAFPILRVSMVGELQPRELYQFAIDNVLPRIEQVEGVSVVTVVGGQEREIRIEVDNERLRSYGLSILQVSQVLGSENLDFPTGKIDEKLNQFIVRVAGKFRSVEEIKSVIVSSTPAGTTYLRDVAEVKDTYKENYTLNRLNGESSLGILIQKRSDANSVKTSDRIKETLTELEKHNGNRIRFTVAQDITDFTRNALDEVQRDLGLAILMVAVVLFLFLQSFRNSIIVLLAIPTSLISTFIMMYALDFTLNLVSLMALALVIGILVDDSIVVLENIHRHLEIGEERVSAAIKGRSEIGFAAIAITLVDVVVFLPVALIGGMVGKIFREFGLTVVVATLLSLFVSFTLTPMLAAKWSKLIRHAKGSLLSRFIERFETLQESLNNGYRSMLAWALDHRKSILAMSAGLLLWSISLVPLGFLGSDFIPQVDRGEFAVNLNMPLGTSLDKTDEAVKSLEAFVAALPEVERLVATIGRQESEWGTKTRSNVGQIQVRLLPESKRNSEGLFSSVKSTSEVMAEIKRKASDIPGLKASFSLISMWGSASAAPMQIEVQGSNLEEVIKVAAQVETITANAEGAVDVVSSWEEGNPEVKIEVDREKAAQMGLTLSEVAFAVRTAIEGDIPTKYKEGNTEYDVRVVLNKSNRVNVHDVAKITLLNHYGQPVELAQVATIYYGKGPSQIARKDRERLVTVAANLSGDRPLSDVTEDIERKLAEIGIPAGVSVFFGGENENMNTMFSDMMLAISLAVLFVYMIMVSLFESYIHPFTIMFSLPVALVGALGSLALTGMTLNMFSMIGIMMSIGLVTKNAILLVDYTNTLRGRGYDVREALLEAGKTRLRPIIMTTATMVFGMMPLALALGAGSEMRQSMGVTIIGALVSSTLLTLVLVPVVYTIVDGLRVKFPALFQRVSWTKLFSRMKPQPQVIEGEAIAK